MAAELTRRYTLYENLAKGVTRYSELPRKDAPSKPKPATIALVRPTVGWTNADTVLAIRGENFAHKGKSLVKAVVVGGVLCQYEVAGPNSLLAVVPADAFEVEGNAVAQEVAVVTTVNVARATDKVTFSRERKEDPPLPTIRVTRDAAGRVTRITVEGDAVADAEELLNTIRAILEHERCCDNVEVNVSSSSSVKKGSGR